jgi:hypothetical protein
MFVLRPGCPLLDATPFADSLPPGSRRIHARDRVWFLVSLSTVCGATTEKKTSDVHGRQR